VTSTVRRFARLGLRVATMVFALAGSAAVSSLGAQGYFGQNQVQYDRLRWKVIETEHFLVHYYPEIGDVAPDAARMAERSYARLSRLMSHQFREKKPILLFGSTGDFAQSNVFGDLGEGTGGVTDPLRQRMAQFFSGDWASFEHVLQHEMVHVFQFDIFSRGRAGAGLQNLAMVNPPLWFMEGLAEYFSIGDKHPWTDAWVRDAVVNNTLPSIQQMTERPDKYFPYRYGLSVWQYVGARWGDEVIGEIMNAVPSLGIERAFRREIGMSLDDLSADWKQAMQSKYLPVVAQLDRPRAFAEPLLSQRRSGSISNLFVAPALSTDGKYITYIAYGSLLRGEVFPEMYLADAQTGKRITRLVKTTTNPDFEQLRFIYSQPSFSPDGKLLAFNGQRSGRDVLYIMDVNSRKTIKSIDLKLDQVLSPSFSPDGRTVVFSGMRQGMSDLYTISLDAPGYKQLTKDAYGDLQPQWSPDGKTIAFVSDRGADTDFEILKVGRLKIAFLDLESGKVSVMPNQAGLNINPQWAPDGRSVAYLSDRTGISNLFLYDLDTREQYQLTNVLGAINAVAELSPAISWARGADEMAFVYYEKGEHAIWKLKNPRGLKKAPFRDATVIAEGGVVITPGAVTPVTPPVKVDPTAHLQRGSVRDTAVTRQSFYRPQNTNARVSSELPASTVARMAETISVRAMMDSFDFNLPDTTRFRDSNYKVRFSPEYVAQPSIGYQQGGFGQGTYGGTTIILSDLLGDHRLALSGSINGQLSDAQVFVGYTSLGSRLQYATGVTQQPIYLLSNFREDPLGGNQFRQSQEIVRLVLREVFLSGLYPLNRFTRFELGARFQNIDQQAFSFFRTVDYNFGIGSGYQRGESRNIASANTYSPYLAWVTDNTLNGYTGPISGTRARMQFEPSFGTWQWNEYLLDARHYTPLLFNYVTFATRLFGNMSVGRDELRFPKWIARPDFIRGYNRDNFGAVQCSGLPTDEGSQCNTVETIGSRVAFANAELRFPIVRRLGGGRSIGLPPLDGLFFYDAGVAWSAGQTVLAKEPANYDFTKQRTLLQSYGFGARLNLFNIAIIRWDWAVPINRPGQKGFGTWFFGASY
jgi:WD40-like Beta Propeller Repeat